jgi:hypothetical protein
MKLFQCCFFITLFLFSYNGYSQIQSKDSLVQQAEVAMLKATQFMVGKVSYNGGYVWYYLPDFTRRWGEMEAYPTMIWLQSPGTVSMGHLFLDAYKATQNEYYYQAAVKAANAIIWGQSHEGGWNYMIDFAGDRSLKEWYNTIGKNGWRLEEFQHYYGNCTFDDDITSDAARFLLRMYLEKLDPVFKPAVDKVIDFILKSQYPTGGWPQRYPLRYDFSKAGHPDYTSFYTFNDDVTWENINFLIQCYQTLGEGRFLDPVKRGMDFYLLSQDTCGGWAQQLDTSLRIAGARTYEPAALLPGATFENAMLLLKFYQFTGEKKFLKAVPAAIRWLERTTLPAGSSQSEWLTHPTFVEPGTSKPLYVHRKGSNVKYGSYYVDYNDDKLLAHYHGKGRIAVGMLKNEYTRIAGLSPEDVMKDSPLKPKKFTENGDPQHFYHIQKNEVFAGDANRLEISRIIRSLDPGNRWLIKHAMISNPYIGDGVNTVLTDEYASTNVGDETDTSPFRDPSDQEYISTGIYIRNMSLLINFVRTNNIAGNHSSPEKQ